MATTWAARYMATHSIPYQIRRTVEAMRLPVAETALLTAAARGDDAALDVLLDEEPALDVRVADDLALMLAAEGGHAAAVVALMEAGANPRARNGLALRLALTARYRAVADAVMAVVGAAALTPDVWAAAARSGSEDVVAYVADHAVPRGRIPAAALSAMLTAAAGVGDLAMVAALIERRGVPTAAALRAASSAALDEGWDAVAAYIDTWRAAMATAHPGRPPPSRARVRARAGTARSPPRGAR